MSNREYARKINIPVTPQCSELYTDFVDWLITISLSKFVQAVTLLTFILGRILFESQPNTENAEVLR
jgi:hypothetical protein